MLDLSPTSLDEALAAAQRFETNRKVLEKGMARVYASGLCNELYTPTYSSEDAAMRSDLIAGVRANSNKEDAADWAKELFQRQDEILQKLNNLPQTREPPRGGKRCRGCFNCGAFDHFKRD